MALFVEPGKKIYLSALQPRVYQYSDSAKLKMPRVIHIEAL
jgi:hypothetical protein